MRGRALLAVLVMVLMSGCAQDGEPEPGEGAGDPSSGSFEQQDRALADGVVTAEEYEQGYRSFSSCMDAGGFAILEGGMYGNVYEYSFPSAARDSGVYDECYEGYFEKLDEAWQIINIDLSPTTAYIKRCLERFGVEPLETYDDVNRQLEENGISFGEC